jgi:hypothetical protein
MSKSKKAKSESLAELVAFFYEVDGGETPSNPKYEPDVKWIHNPLLEIDLLMGFLERGIDLECELAEDIVYWADNALGCIEAKGQNFRWTFFKDFDGKFNSRPDTPIGSTLREMHVEHEFMAWKPYLERIREIAALMVKTTIAEQIV